MKRRILTGLLAGAALNFVLPFDSLAADCGAGAWCPCPNTAYGKCMDRFNSCEEACGLTQSGGGNSSSYSRGYDAGAAARQAAAAQEAERERENERRAKEARERKEREDQFIRDRDAGVGELRGVIGTKTTANSAGPELRGVGAVDTGIRDVRPDRKARADLGGTHAAWKQLNCAAGIAGYAMDSLNLKVVGPRGAPDFKEFTYLSGEAINALNGGTVGVECPPTAALPRTYGKGGAERYKKDYLAMLERSRELADVLKKTLADREAVHARVFEAKKRLTPLREAPAVAAAPKKDESSPETPAAPVKKKGQAAELAAAALREAERQEQELAQLEAATRKKLELTEKITKKVEAGEADALGLLEQEEGKK